MSVGHLYRSFYETTHPIKLNAYEEIPQYHGRMMIPRRVKTTYTSNFQSQHDSHLDSRKWYFKFDGEHFFFKTEEDRTMFLLRFA
jgi:hypothetical protein